MYDVIVVGARVAGSPTAMLLAQRGYKVLLVDRASFPSDTLSTHQVQLKGGAALQRWRLLDKVLASNCPPTHKMSFITDSLTLQGEYPPLEGVGTVICPRRTILDKILVDAAVEAGAELREDLLVEELTFEDKQVTGIRGRIKSHQSEKTAEVREKARLVVGADGKHSLVARSVEAQVYNAKPALTCAYYTYWEGVQLECGKIFVLPQLAAGVWPTNDGLTMIYTAYPITEFQSIRENIEARFWNTMELLPGLSEKVRNGKQAERFYGTADLPAFYRHPYGPGWALVGDAGMALDPITGQGIGNAFRDAERLAEAIDAGFSGQKPLETALAEYKHQRDTDTRPMYKFTSQLTEFQPPSAGQKALFAAMAKKPAAVNRFFGALTGSVRFQEFFSSRSLINIIGVTGIGRMLFSKMTAFRQKPAGPAGRGGEELSG
jgi:2-polyprenyl-6-methoxyphenol hydroxylase-like FAD-dependent oxidoreductase